MECTDTELERREFPWRIRLARRSLGLTLEELARRVGVTKGALSRYESGELRVLGDATLGGVCEALGVPKPEWLSPPQGGTASKDRPRLAATARYYCPSPYCALQRPLVLAREIRFIPGLVLSEPEAEVECRYCAATMFSSCRHCGAALDEGSTLCPSCHEDYVPHQPLDAGTMAILQFNAATVARPPSGSEVMPFWPPSRVRATEPGAAGSEGMGGAVKRGGSSDGGAA